jgi:hypothetical protein
MILSQLANTLIFAVVLAMSAVGNTGGNLDKTRGPAAEAEVQKETVAAGLNSVGSEERIDVLEATNKDLELRLSQIEGGSREGAELSFWFKIAIFVASLLGLFGLLLVTFSHHRLSSRVNQLDRKLEGVSRRLEKFKFDLASLQEVQIPPPPPPPPVSWHRPPNSSHYFDDNFPKRGAGDHAPVDTSNAPPQPPSPPPPASRLHETAEELRRTISAMIADPGMRVSTYEGELTKFGTVFGLELESDGQNVRLVAAGPGASRSLTAVLLKNEQEVIIVPSSRFAKDFAMTFKGILEAGNDTKAVFDCHIDGSGILRVSCLATGQVEGFNIRNLQKGDLSGFVA